MTATDAWATRQAIRGILNGLDDSFDTVFPLQQIMGDLDRGIQQAEASIQSKFVYGAGVPAWSEVEVEHHREVISYNRGAALVLCQVLLTQVVADVRRLKSLTGNSNLVGGKTSILKLLDQGTLGVDLSEVAAIFALANYFKHYREWSHNWEELKGNASYTKRDVEKLGLNFQSRGDVGPGFHRLGAETCEELLDIVVRWRERLHRHLTELTLIPREPLDVVDGQGGVYQ